ncbi:hypothetical protein OOZ63_24150 [Paucibacter sp. PLA-PC-4]|uniref:WD40/YVTN/BNR-like repeat-containing protein n=1 Tax=Paucibacter sp. PLA-PC-4 TaxID=2993655 RepID=UPI00224AFDBC|nr:sialidase family protein [Paucibacter sp. PLA-PC-4]MCX2864928.1 hypothetical protein [Paucibacter sp. PLA-PC-4]
MHDTRTLSHRLITPLITAILSFAAAGCGGGAGDAPQPVPPPPATPQFIPEGLQGRIVSRLRPSDAGVLAATDAGVFQRSGGAWEPRGLADQTILDVIAISGQRWIASARPTADGPAATPQLLKTVDGGASWEPIPSNFGGPLGPEPAHALAFDGPRQRLVATGSDVLAESRDEGRTWTVLHGDWHGFSQPKAALVVHAGSGDIWYGGQDAIEGLILFGRAEATRQVVTHAGLLPSPSVVKGLQFATAVDAAHLLIAGEGGVVQTRDGGATWEKLLHDGYNFYFDVAFDAYKPGRLVSARWMKNYDTPQAAHLVVSDDAGKTWRSFQTTDPALFGGAWAIHALQESGRTSYLLGLYKGGVMRVELP